MSPSPVQVLVTSLPVPTILNGEMIARQDDSLTVRCGTDLAADTSVVVVPEQTNERIVARVQSSINGVVTLAVRLARPPERREWPRMVGSVPLRWKRSTDEFQTGAWLAGDLKADASWQRPDSLMSFSVTGLAFETREDIPKGSQLLIEMGVGHDPRRWRCTATVVRVLPPLQADGEGVRLAVQLEHVPSEASGALSELTLELQSAMM